MINYAYYTTEYKGTDAEEASFPVFLAHAQRIIDAMCRWQVTESNLSTFPEIVQKLYKFAICAQIDFFVLNGLESINSTSGGGFTVGKVTVHGNSQTGKSGAMSNAVSPSALMYLEQSGLMNPAVPVVGCFTC